MPRAILFSALLMVIVSCNEKKDTLTPGQIADVKDSVQIMAQSIAKDISQQGPKAWLQYFEDAPDFFMASEGKLVFPNIDTAKNIINTKLITIISKIELHWSDVRIHPLTASLAGMAATFHEDITDVSGKTTPHDGYFTGLAHQTPQGWKLLNAHWSVVAAQ
jgi:hypothetical protein